MLTAEIKNVLVFGEGSPRSHSIEDFVPEDSEHFGVSNQGSGSVVGVQLALSQERRASR